VNKQFLRYSDLKAMGLVNNWTTLLRWINGGDFPAGLKLGANTRAWPREEIEKWLESRRHG